MTMVEVLVVVAILLLLWFLIPAATHSNKSKAQRARCVNNQKQIVIGFREWAGDSDYQFPWRYSAEAMGYDHGDWRTVAEKLSPEVHFLMASNRIKNTLSLYCPSDRQRQFVTNWNKLTRTNLSYFINLEANENIPRTIVLGDRNLTVNSQPTAPGLAIVTTNDTLAWDGQMHNQCGNVALADLSVQQVSITNLNRQLQSSGIATNRFVVP